MSLSARSASVVLCLILIAHAVVSMAQSRTLRPWSDEGAMAAPAHDLITRGSMGTGPWDESIFPGIHTRTYYAMPAYFVALAPWFRVMGVSLFSMRLFSLFWALIALLACYVLARGLSFSREWALVSTALVAADYMFIQSSSFGRMDMMSAAAGLSSLAIYLALRERGVPRALFAAASLNALAVFTHPIAMVHFFGLVFLVLFFDWKRLTIGAVALAAVPFLIATAGWGWYILQSPNDFKGQFLINATYMGRLNAFSAPLTALKRELISRYLLAYGLGGHSAGTSGPVYLKSIALLAYVLGWCGCVYLARAEKAPSFRVLPILIAVYFLVMTLVDGTRNTFYLVHITPFFAASLALFAGVLYRRDNLIRACVVAVLCATAAIQVGGVLYKARLNSYANRYLPAVEFLKANMKPGSIIAGSSAFAFDFGFDRTNLIDDPRLGYESGIKPDFFILDEVFAENLEGQKRNKPAVAAYVGNLLQNEYVAAFDHAAIVIYRRK